MYICIYIYIYIYTYIYIYIADRLRHPPEAPAQATREGRPVDRFCDHG